MKNIVRFLLLFSIVISFSSPCFSGTEANISVTSDYVWRGISQTANQAAVQGGIDFTSESGFFSGIWLSNTAFNSNEWDIYVGYASEAESGISYSAMFNYYYYPSIEADSDFGELIFDLAYGFISLNLAYTAVSSIEEGDEFAEGDLHYSLSISNDVGNDWNLGISYGIYDFDNDDALNSSYGYMQIDAIKSLGEFGEFGFSLSITDEEAQVASDNDDADEPIARISWSKSFE